MLGEDQSSLFHTYLPAEAREEDLAGLVLVLELIGDLEEGRAGQGGVSGLQEPSSASLRAGLGQQIKPGSLQVTSAGGAPEEPRRSWLRASRSDRRQPVPLEPSRLQENQHHFPGVRKSRDSKSTCVLPSQKVPLLQP